MPVTKLYLKLCMVYYKNVCPSIRLRLATPLITITSTSDLQPSTVISNQLPGQLVPTQI